MEDFEKEITRLLAKEKLEVDELAFLRARRSYLSDNDAHRLFGEKKKPFKCPSLKASSCESIIYLT